jgi:phytoene dehydrogenase-like protein
MIATVDRYAPGFAGSVVARQVLTPLDLERVFGLTGGDIMHGRLELDQLFAARPVLGHGNYRMPLPGLYLCGSGSHPGGGVTGAPGHNAAREVLKDLGRQRGSADATN